MAAAAVAVDHTALHNSPDEWKIEQGLHGAKLPFLDQTGRHTVPILPAKWPTTQVKNEEAIKAVGDRDKLFARELEGWRGYVAPGGTGILMLT